MSQVMIQMQMITSGKRWQVEIQNNHPNLQKILKILKTHPKYYDKNQKIIKFEEFEAMTNTEAISF